MKQGFHEMITISVLNKVKSYGVSGENTVSSYLKHSNASSKAQTWQIVAINEDVPSRFAA